ncbi:MAG: polysaccharide deacetylase family protein [Flavobacteriaceae bacterium]|jgi:peptidoglycan/xylan/chitin deacetylase (PgdA/CDA1 family)|nr:polysaccharide deacetylase family protein [Flavobacteriaceae bacterium]HTO36160.1 polysaccharide deacetylase family protein [Flavobacterium sp.]
MNKFWVKTNSLVRFIYPGYVWKISNEEKKVFLTFDDGPTPEVTEWVLETLQKYNAKATFFCIGKNIKSEPKIFRKIISGGHVVGNHTFNHLKGWRTNTKTYIENVKKCSEICIEHSQDSDRSGFKRNNLFRPPYGKIKNSQAKGLKKLGYRIIMWDIISMDFDPKITNKECLNNVINNIEEGSIIVFHDSFKAYEKLKAVLPETLEYLKENNYSCATIC